jgi:hypothetical protein
MNLISSLAALAAAAFALAPASVSAGEGHDHGDAAAPVAGEALPRFTAASETFELVGVLSGKRITLYLDRYADNSPVRDAQIELEIGGAKFKAEKNGDDEYEVALAEAPRPGVLPVTATAMAGNEADLLAGELDIHDEAQTGEDAHTHSWQEVAGWAAGGVAALGLLVWIGRRAMSARAVRAGGAA